MKNLKAFCAACLLALMLAVPSFAGHIQTGITEPPPPPPPPSETADEQNTSNAAGHIQTGITSTDSLTEATLLLLQTVLALP